MKRKFAVALATSLALASLAGCGGGGAAATGSNTGADTKTDEGADAKTDTASDSGSGVDTSAAELNLIIASNQTSLENPYSYGMDKFKEVVEEKSGGKIAVTVHKGTLGENESELIEKLLWELQTW